MFTITTSRRWLLPVLCCLLVSVGPRSWGQETAAPQATQLQNPQSTPGQTVASEPASQKNGSAAERNSAAQKTAAEQKNPAAQKTAASEISETPDFVRVSKHQGVPQALQTAVATYRKPNDQATKVVLIGAVHIAEPAYYSQLNQLFKSYDALLYEMVSDPGMGIPDPEERGLSPISTIQVGMKEMLELTFQLDEINYKAKNFVHADMTPQEFFDTMNARKEGVLQMFFRSLGSGIAMQSTGRGGDMGLLAALVSKDRARGLRRAFADQMEMMDGQMAAITGEDGKSTLITERNAKAFEVLKRELQAGKQQIGIFYGAGHLKDMHQRLVNEFGMELVETEWLTAWEL